jgi:hypothetical protein
MICSNICVCDGHRLPHLPLTTEIANQFDRHLSSLTACQKAALPNDKTETADDLKPADPPANSAAAATEA